MPSLLHGEMIPTDDAQGDAEAAAAVVVTITTILHRHTIGNLHIKRKSHVQDQDFGLELQLEARLAELQAMHWVEVRTGDNMTGNINLGHLSHTTMMITTPDHIRDLRGHFPLVDRTLDSDLHDVGEQD